MHAHDYDFHAERETVIAAKNEDVQPSPPLPNGMDELVTHNNCKRENQIITICVLLECMIIL